METCRTCAKSDFGDETNWMDLFHSSRWVHEIKHIREELSNWKLEISQNDGLPQKICSECFSKFCTVYSFRLDCERAQLKLNNIFDKIENHCIEELEELQQAERAQQERLEELLEKDQTKNRPKDAKDILLNLFELCKDLGEGEENSNCGDGPNKSAPTDIPEVSTYTATSNEVSNVKAVLPTATEEEEEEEEAAAGENVVNLEQPGDILQGENFEQSRVLVAPENLEQAKDLVEAEEDQVQPIEDFEQSEDLIQEDDFEQEEAEEDIEQSASELVEADEDLSELIDDSGIIEQFEPVTITNLMTIDQIECGENSNSCDDPDSNSNADINISFQCKFCYTTKDTPAEQYTTQQELLDHVTLAHNTYHPFNCPNCRESFSDAASRTVHIKDQHVEKLYVCTVCGKKYADRFNLRHHVEKYHSESDFECTLCEKRFYSRKSLNYHMKWHNPDKQLKCSYCTRLFINQRHLDCHEATHTGLRNSEYCSFCGKSFIHLKTLRWHIYRQHGGEKPYKCGNCPEVFASYKEKRLHMLENHLENLTSIEKTECMTCHKNFENETDLKEHMKEHDKTLKSPTLVISNNKRVVRNKRQKNYSGIFQCDVCSQRFNMKSALERHSAVHSIEGRPHACPKCQKRFKRAQDMNWHMKTHSDEKPNVCDVCGKGFALKYVLTQHKRSHEVLEKNFKCATCGRAYLFEKSLRVHERVHTGKTYYKCDLCSESFVTHIKMKWHMRKMHTPDTNTREREFPLDELVNFVIR